MPCVATKSPRNALSNEVKKLLNAPPLLETPMLSATNQRFICRPVSVLCIKTSASGRPKRADIVSVTKSISNTVSTPSMFVVTVALPVPFIPDNRFPSKVELTS